MFTNSFFSKSIKLKDSVCKSEEASCQRISSELHWVMLSYIQVCFQTLCQCCQVKAVVASWPLVTKVNLKFCWIQLLCVCVCGGVFVDASVLLQQKHLADVGPKLLHSYSKSSLFRLASHRHTHTGVLYLRQSEPPAFHIPSLLVSLNPPWLNTYSTKDQLSWNLISKILGNWKCMKKGKGGKHQHVLMGRRCHSFTGNRLGSTCGFSRLRGLSSMQFIAGKGQTHMPGKGSKPKKRKSQQNGGPKVQMAHDKLANKGWNTQTFIQKE